MVLINIPIYAEYQRLGFWQSDDADKQVLVHDCKQESPEKWVNDFEGRTLTMFLSENG